MFILAHHELAFQAHLPDVEPTLDTEGGKAGTKSKEGRKVRKKVTTKVSCITSDHAQEDQGVYFHSHTWKKQNDKKKEKQRV